MGLRGRQRECFIETTIPGIQTAISVKWRVRTRALTERVLAAGMERGAVLRVTETLAASACDGGAGGSECA
jgi:hypothetical protein